MQFAKVPIKASGRLDGRACEAETRTEVTVGAVDVAPGAPLTMNFAARIDRDPADIWVTGLRLLEYNHDGKELPLLIEVAGFGVEVALKGEADKESKVNGVIAGVALDDGIMTDRELFNDMTNMCIQPPARAGAAHLHKYDEQKASEEACAEAWRGKDAANTRSAEPEPLGEAPGFEYER